MAQLTLETYINNIKKLMIGMRQHFYLELICQIVLVIQGWFQERLLWNF